MSRPHKLNIGLDSKFKLATSAVAADPKVAAPVRRDLNQPGSLKPQRRKAGGRRREDSSEKKLNSELFSVN